jgi:FkbM family methyltransferase
MRPLRRLGVEALRLPGRTVPIPGWFPLVVEGFHAHVRPAGNPVRVRINGMLMDLDLDEYVQRRIFYHAHEVAEARWVRRALRPGDHFVDVGANVGYFTMAAAGVVGPAGRITAFEPVPGNIAALRHNADLNGLSNVEVRPVAAGAEPGSIHLGLNHPESHPSGVSGHYTQGGARGSIEVPVEALDSVSAHQPPVRLLKMDVEGSEPRVLAGLERCLAERPPRAIITEVNPGALGEQGFEVSDLVRPLRAAGYRLHRITARGRTGKPASFDIRRKRPRADVPSGRVAMVFAGLRGEHAVDAVVALHPEFGRD